MRYLKALLVGFFLFAAFCAVVRAEDSKPAPTVEQLQIEIDALKSELAQLRISSSFEMRVCNAAVQAAREFVTKPAASTNTPRILPRTQQNGPAAKSGSQP